jgi:hypothetical protein
MVNTLRVVDVVEMGMTEPDLIPYPPELGRKPTIGGSHHNTHPGRLAARGLAHVLRHCVTAPTCSPIHPT